METMLRRFGIKKVEPRETDARLKLQKELFYYQKCADYGFPNKASCFAYNEQLNLLAIGTKDGCIKIYGAPGVQLTAEHEFDVAIQEIFFFGTQGTLVTYVSENVFHLWELEDQSEFREVKSLPADDRFRKATTFCLSQDHKYLYVGSESGHVYTLVLDSFKFSEHVLYQENVTNRAPEEAQQNAGAVESIQEHPMDSNQILIGYNRGLIALHNVANKESSKYFNSNQQLECLCFNETGDKFLSCHSNGSYAIWSVRDTSRPLESMTPYGPFPCKAITKLLWRFTSDRNKSMMIFSGGMPRASYGDRHAVSVMCDNRHVTFDLSSKVIDFLVVRRRDGCYGDADKEEMLSSNESLYAANQDLPDTLFILSEEEFVAVDLSSDGWPVFQVPYMATLHATAITCCTHVGKVDHDFYEELAKAGRNQKKGKVSTKPWPITGGINCGGDQSNVQQHDLLVTGHEDGAVRIWDVSTTNISLLLKFSTNEIFETSSVRAEESAIGPNYDDEGEDEWPPFRKVGSYDPYSDDPRLAVRKVELCKDKMVMVVAGTAGQLIVSKFKETETTFDEFDLDFRPVRLNIVDERANFTWKGHEPVTLRKGRFKVEAGFQPICIAQAFPPATCTSLAVNTDWELAAIGTAHGFGLVDYKLKKYVEVKCTLNAADLSGSGEAGMSRRKSFKKSLRESFRRLRSRRSERHKKVPLGVRGEDEKLRQLSPQRTSLTQSSSKQSNMATTVIDLDIPKPVERAVEARSASDVEGSIVRTLYFADTFLLNGHTHGPTFWAGTNSGTVFIYHLTVPDESKRRDEEVQGTLAKEVRLRHRAPIMNIVVVDKHMTSLLGSKDSTGAKTPDMSHGHSVIICSEEQIKIFSLPNLSAKEKFKLTANEGTKIRKVGYANFSNKSDPKHSETCLTCLTNLGEVNIFSIPSLRRQLKADCIRKDNIMGIVSCVFTPSGEGFYMDSSSQFSRFSVSAKIATRPNCKICAGDN